MVRTARYCAPEGLQVSPSLWDLANTFVAKQILHKIDSNLAYRTRRGLVHQPLGVIIGAHNHAIMHLVRVVCDPLLAAIRWPAPELAALPHRNLPPVQWNSAAYQSALKKVQGQIQIQIIFKTNIFNNRLKSAMLFLNDIQIRFLFLNVKNVI